MSRVAGEIVEEFGRVRARFFVRREHAEVCIGARGRRVVVAGADVQISSGRGAWTKRAYTSCTVSSA